MSPSFPIRLPGPWRGLRIGLFGGSFNPAHGGHLHVAQTALDRLGLDWVWWMPAAGNPLKSAQDNFDARFASAQARVGEHPRMRVSDVERQLGTRYTRDTLKRLLPLCQGAHFVWLMGADNLAGFHHWGGWREIAEMIPIAVIARPDAGIRARGSAFARTYASARLTRKEAAGLAFTAPPAWVFLTAPFHPASSTDLRRAARLRNPFRTSSPA